MFNNDILFNMRTSFIYVYAYINLIRDFVLKCHHFKIVPGGERNNFFFNCSVDTRLIRWGCGLTYATWLFVWTIVIGWLSSACWVDWLVCVCVPIQSCIDFRLALACLHTRLVVWFGCFVSCFVRCLVVVMHWSDSHSCVFVALAFMVVTVVTSTSTVVMFMVFLTFRVVPFVVGTRDCGHDASVTFVTGCGICVIHCCDISDFTAVAAIHSWW